jgi:DNA-binding response OmpR family regulator
MTRPHLYTCLKPDGDDEYSADDDDDRPPGILVAEDDPAMRDVLVQSLRAEGYQVFSAEDGLELFTSFDDRFGPAIVSRFADVDLILSDIRMPWLTGLDVLQELRAREQTVPVILITAFGDDATHAEARRLGAVEIFDKPFDMVDLLACIRTALSRQENLGREHPP